MESKEEKRRRVREMGLKNRRHEERCEYCGKEEHYAKGLCKNCYNRKNRTGTVEYYENKVKKNIRLSKEQVEKGLEDIWKEREKLEKEDRLKIYKRRYQYKKYGNKISYKALKELYRKIGKDIIKEIGIEKKYTNAKKYNV